jgi:hypothetical protein
MGARVPEDLRTLGKTVAEDLRRGGIGRTLRRDLRDLYDFYLDEDRRQRLAGMGRIRRSVFLVGYLLRSLFLRLTPVRRLLVLLALWLQLSGDLRWTGGSAALSLNFQPFSVALLLFVLMLELRDKLLARDELAVGRAVQMALLPKEQPSIPGWEAWLFTRPANDVGGDLVDYLPFGDGHLGVALGDVSGKGLGAALLMAKLQSTLRALAPGAENLPSLAARTNAILHRDGLPGRFATLVFLVPSPETGRVRLVNAGHIPPVIVRRDTQESLAPTSLPLGTFPEARYVEQEAVLEPGDLLLVYSDGLTDARNEKGQFFGDEALSVLLPSLGGCGAEEAGRRILARVDAFCGSEKPFDDLSLVVLRRAEGPTAVDGGGGLAYNGGARGPA